MREYLKGTMVGFLVGTATFLIYVALTDQLQAYDGMKALMIFLIGAGGVIGTLVGMYMERLGEFDS